MKKQPSRVLFSVFVCLAMLLPCIGATAAAQEGVIVEAGGTGFASLNEAVAAILEEDGQSGTVRVVGDTVITERLVVPAGADITITDDGSAHTVSSAYRLHVEAGGRLTIDGKDLTFNKGLVSCAGEFVLRNGVLDMGGSEFRADYTPHTESGGVVVCGEQARFIMDGGVIRSAKVLASTGGVRVCCNASFVMNGGTITDIHNESQTDAGPVLVYAGNTLLGKGAASFTMNGGVIENNTNYRGGGVHVTGKEYTYRASMEMNGGIIRNNTCNGFQSAKNYASGGGGGIYISGNAQVVMNDGKIVGNTVNGGQGGGVCTIDGYYNTFSGGPNSPGAWPIEQYAQYYPAAFTMNGGEISGNSAIKGDTEADAATGGGVYIASNCVTLRGGCIENNYAEQQGGGVYIGSIPYSMRIYNAVITGNSATLLGGGIWACPTGDTEAFVTNGAAIFDNAAEGAGDDVVSVKTAGQDYVLTLADRMLGGGRADWYADGALADGDDAMGQPAPDAPRYDAASEAEPLAQIQNSTEPYALKAVASEEAKALANACGALFIRGNRSERGGGIGSNGGVVMGESDKAYSLTVTKAWADAEEALQTSVTVYLKVGDSVLDAVVLNAENGWTASFTGLPDPSSLADGLAYSVAENPVPAFFEPILSEPSLDEETKTISITLTNRYIPHGDLTVSKIISGSAADAAEAFPFTVVLDDETIEGVYGDMTFAGGVASFTLRGGETVTAVGLPAGVGYTVTETDSGGYEAEARGATGVIADGQTAQAVFSNHKDKPAESEPSDDTSVPEPSDGSDSSSVSSEAPGVSESSDASSTPSTGDARMTGVYTALLLLCGCAAVLTVRRKGRGE